MATPKDDKIDHVKFSEHSRIIYWWPVWFFGYILGLINLIYGDANVFNSLEAGANWHSLLNLIYVIVILFVIYVTNVRTTTNVALLAVACVVISALLLFIFAGTSNLMKYIPSFSIFINKKFYFTFSTVLLIIWLCTVFLVDQWVCAYLHAGTVTLKRFRAEKVYTMEGMIVAMTNDDLPCHHLLGLGHMGDVVLTVGNDQKRFRYSNVANVRAKVKEARRMIADAPNLAPPGIKK